MLELPIRDPCGLCEGIADREEKWGIGPPQLATFETAGRPRGTTHDSTGDVERTERVQVSADQL